MKNRKNEQAFKLCIPRFLLCSSIVLVLVLIVTVLHIRSKNNELTEYSVTTYSENDFFKNDLDYDIHAIKLKKLLNCKNKDFKPRIFQRGNFTILENYIRADHGEINCYETITYTTHVDFTFMDNIVPLLLSWKAPLSISVYAPGTDFDKTIESINYLRNCGPDQKLVKLLATFHIYFDNDHFPKEILKVATTNHDCEITPPFKLNITDTERYKTEHKLFYPVNVGRNVARDAALTHFILASDIELYPSSGLVDKFLKMITRNQERGLLKNLKVYPLPIFEIDETKIHPKNKIELLQLIKEKMAFPFHESICRICHAVPGYEEWLTIKDSKKLGISRVAQRIGPYEHWEPIYIGTNREPYYDERLSWEGKSDKMTQGHIMCVLNYEFHILDNAFLVHKPGIKSVKESARRELEEQTNDLIKTVIAPELNTLYGKRRECQRI